MLVPNGNSWNHIGFIINSHLESITNSSTLDLFVSEMSVQWLIYLTRFCTYY